VRPRHRASRSIRSDSLAFHLHSVSNSLPATVNWASAGREGRGQRRMCGCGGWPRKGSAGRLRAGVTLLRVADPLPCRPPQHSLARPASPSGSSVVSALPAATSSSGGGRAPFTSSRAWHDVHLVPANGLHTRRSIAVRDRRAALVRGLRICPLPAATLGAPCTREKGTGNWNCRPRSAYRPGGSRRSARGIVRANETVGESLP